MTNKFAYLNRMSLERAIEIAEDLASKEVKGFAISDLLYHYGCEAIYQLRKYGIIIADLKLADSSMNIKNTIEIMLAAGASYITIHHISRFTPKEFSPFCILSLFPGAPSPLTCDYDWIYFASAEFDKYANQPFKKVSVGDSLTTAEINLSHWSNYLSKSPENSKI